jgi:hypothetical protein
VGAYPTYQDAAAAWRAKAQQTVDNALMRYFIIHAHKLLNPETTTTRTRGCGSCSPSGELSATPTEGDSTQTVPPRFPC